MSRVYIKGLKMPKNCAECKLHNIDYDVALGRDVEVCEATNLIIMCDPRKDKMAWCPLREEK